MAVVDWRDVQTSVGRALTIAEQSQVGLWADQALLIIEHRLGDPGELDQRVLVMVVVEAVARRIKRPDDATQVSITVDGDTAQRSYQSSSGTITILPDEWALLAASTDGGGAVGAFTIRPARA